MWRRVASPDRGSPMRLPPIAAAGFVPALDSVQESVNFKKFGHITVEERAVRSGYPAQRPPARTSSSSREATPLPIPSRKEWKCTSASKPPGSICSAGWAAGVIRSAARQSRKPARGQGNHRTTRTTRPRNSVLRMARSWATTTGPTMCRAHNQRRIAGPRPGALVQPNH